MLVCQNFSIYEELKLKIFVIVFFIAVILRS